MEDSSSSILEYNDSTYEYKGGMVPVRLKFSDEGVTFKRGKGGKTETIPVKELEVINWQRLAGGHGIRIFVSDGSLYRFGGFRESDKSKLEKFIKKVYSKTMSDREFSYKGWNYGEVKFDGDSLSFDISKLTAFEVPLSNVSQCIAGKNEVTMEFHQNDDIAVSLVELRFHLPPTELAGEDHVETFKERVMKKAQVITATGDAMAIFQQVQCLTPRGRYDMKFYPTFVQLHGKTFDFKVPINSVLRLFLLPNADMRQHYFIVSLDPPIKQGQTRYPYLILQFPDEDEEDVELPLTEEELKEKYEGRLEKEMSGPVFEIVSKLFKGMCQRKIVAPGSFVGTSESPAIGCSYKAASGHLYPLERGFFFLYKPPLHIRHEDIASINFARSGSTGRSFDLEIKMKDNSLSTFSNLEKGEHPKLYAYVSSKKLRITNKNSQPFSTKKSNKDGDAGNEPDHYMNRVRAEANERDSDDGDDDDSESEDEDFNPGAEVSDVAEEFDSNASSSGSDVSDGAVSDGGSPLKKVKKPKEPKPKKTKTVSDKPRMKRKPKKEKDENRPKRPMAGYFIWLGEHREQIKSENPGISITEISKKAGEMWRAITDKSEWDAKAAEAKKVYQKAMEEYIASGGGAKESSGGTTKTKKEKKGAPKPSKILSPTKSGSGKDYKSQEYIDDNSSSGTDSDDKPLNKIKSEKSSPAKKKVKKEESEEGEEMAESEEDGDSDDDKPLNKIKSEKSSPVKKEPKKEESEEEEEMAESEEDGDNESDGGDSD